MVRPTRRQLLGGIGTVTAASLGYTLGVQDATAAVTIDDFSIPDGEASGDIHAPWVRITGQYQYDLADTREIGVLLLAGSSQGVVAMDRFDVSSDSGSGEYQISGDITNVDAYDTSDFAVGSETDVRVGVMLQLRDSGGSTMQTDSVYDTGTVRVTEDTTAVISMDGTGEWGYEKARGDGSPF